MTEPNSDKYVTVDVKKQLVDVMLALIVNNTAGPREAWATMMSTMLRLREIEDDPLPLDQFLESIRVSMTAGYTEVSSVARPN